MASTHRLALVTNSSLNSPSEPHTTIFDPISDEISLIGDIVVYTILCGSISMLGIVTNIMNIAVFYKQGLDSSMNICFFGLAIADLCSVITIQWTSICMNPILDYTDFPFDGDDAEYLIGSWPHVCFGHIGCWITAYITAERYLCIALPLKVKQIVTPRRTTILLCFMYFINIVPFFIEASSTYMDWTFYPERNRSLLALHFKEYRKDVEGIGFILLGICGFITLPVVIIFTAILVVKLRQQSAWRNKTTRDAKQASLTSKRDIKTMNMVVLIASVLIVCYIPGVLVSIATFIVPEFSVKGRLKNVCFFVWAFVFTFEAFNSSINIFLYYKMSTRYKNTFHQLFGCCLRKKSTAGNLPISEDD